MGSARKAQPPDDPFWGDFGKRWNRMWLETWAVVSEHGPLVIFLALAAGLDVARRKLAVESELYIVLVVAEAATVATMVGPKALAALRDLLELVVIYGHDVVYAMLHGSRRPRPRLNPPGEEPDDDRPR